MSKKIFLCGLISLSFILCACGSTESASNEIDASQIETTQPQAICEYENCSTPVDKAEDYCDEHECAISICDKGRMTDSKYCPKCWMTDYEDVDGVPDFGEIFNVDNDDEASESIESTMIGGGMSAYVYYLDSTQDNLVKEWKDLLMEKGFSLEENEGEISTMDAYTKDECSIITSYSQCEDQEKGEKIFMMMITGAEE